MTSDNRHCHDCGGYLPEWYNLGDEDNSYYFTNLNFNAGGIAPALMVPVHHKCRPIPPITCEGLHVASSANNGGYGGTQIWTSGIAHHEVSLIRRPDLPQNLGDQLGSEITK